VLARDHGRALNAQSSHNLERGLDGGAMQVGHLMREAIRGHQRQSEAIRGNQEVIRGHLELGHLMREAIGG
jgi:hypothetical protein